MEAEGVGRTGDVGTYRADSVAGVILTQILPFADPTVLRLYGEFESGVYGALKAA